MRLGTVRPRGSLLRATLCGSDRQAAELLEPKSLVPTGLSGGSFLGQGGASGGAGRILGPQARWGVALGTAQ